MNEQLKISIITVTLNRVNDLKKTIESVEFIKKTNNSIEYVIVDGGSCDGTLDLLELHHCTIDKLLIEADSGLYDAMNKGAKLSSGTHLLFLNAGDMILYLDSVLPNKTSTCFFYDVLNKEVKRKPLSKTFLSRNMVCHQSVFYSKSDFIDFDYKMPIYADYKQLAQIVTNFPVYNNSIVLYDVPSLSGNVSKFKDLLPIFHMRLTIVSEFFGYQYLIITILSFVGVFVKLIFLRIKL